MENALYLTTSEIAHRQIYFVAINIVLGMVLACAIKGVHG